MNEASSVQVFLQFQVGILRPLTVMSPFSFINSSNNTYFPHPSSNNITYLLHTRTHACTHTRAHAHTHTHTHTHKHKLLAQH